MENTTTTTTTVTAETFVTGKIMILCDIQKQMIECVNMLSLSTFFD